jgi:AcrR family transcriptional regulator
MTAQRRTAQSSKAKASPPRERASVEDASGSTRSRILAEAERLFAEQGYGDVSMPMIATASGITAGAIYKHFDGKADLFFEIVRRAVHAAPTPQPQDSADATLLPRLVATYTTRDLKRLRQLAVEIHYASTKHPKVRQLLRRSLEANAAQLSAGVEALQQAGTLSKDLDSKLLAVTALVFIMGLMHMETLAPDLVGDAGWADFTQDRFAALIGLPGGP